MPVIVDYDAGNVRSVQRACERANMQADISADPETVANADRLIFPGVGSAASAVDTLNNRGLDEAIRYFCGTGRPLLGICLGLQLLFESSDEGNLKGLGVIQGKIRKLPEEKNERIPHIGWSPIYQTNKCPILEDYPNSNWMYFVHSYSACPFEQKNIVATTKFGKTNVSSIVWHKNTGACQFHPEKSGIAGQKLIFNWLQWLKRTTF